jgi:hypothetical protein
MQISKISGSRTVALTECTAMLDRKIRLSHLRSTFSGALVAIALAGFSLQPWANQLARFDAKPLSQDREDARFQTVHYFSEGIATAHLTPSRARITGQPPVAGAPYVVIMGNSFVEALQVSDLDTMGAVAERLARQQGDAINVRQYGWSGASPVKYALDAGTIEQLWSPRMVVIVTHKEDFGASALHTHWSVAAVHDGIIAGTLLPTDTSSLRARVARKITSIGLITLATRRFALDILPGIENFLTPSSATAAKRNSDSDAEVTLAMLQMLKKAYGAKLFLVYASEPSLKLMEADEVGARVLEDCSELEIQCASTDKQARRGIVEGSVFLNGFLNTAPAEGHYNRDGHRVVGEIIWNEYRRREFRGPG